MTLARAEAWADAERFLSEHAAPCALASWLHGPRHWRAVARIGVEVARCAPHTA